MHADCLFGILRQQSLIIVIHVKLLTQRRNFIRTALMKSKIALIAIETGEQETATALTKGQRKEGLAHKLM